MNEKEKEVLKDFINSFTGSTTEQTIEVLNILWTISDDEAKDLI